MRSWRHVRLVALLIVVEITKLASVHLYYPDSAVSFGESALVLNTAVRVREFPSGTVSAHALSSSKPCLVVEGEVCHCYDAAYSDAVITWTDRCQAIRDTALANKNTFSYALLLYPQYTEGEDTSSATNNRNGPQQVLSTSPVYISHSQSGEMVPTTSPKLTLVLPLTLDDLSRAVLILRSLQAMSLDIVHEMLVFVPDSQLSLLQGALLGTAAECQLTFPVRVIPERVLFHASSEVLSNAYPYGLQMAIKLLAADLVRTPYYLTLDADILQLHQFLLEDLLVPTAGAPGSADREVKALYHFEERGVHENWWAGSERVLNVSAVSSHVYHRWRQAGTCLAGDTTCSGSSEESSGAVIPDGAPSPMQKKVQGFGVTPAVLSTYGSQLTVSHLCRTLTHNLDYETPIDRAECERQWLGGFARPYMTADGEPTGELMVWSEYTLYRIALDHYQVFDELHVSEETAGALKGRATDFPRLHCFNVWYAAQLPWLAEEASRAMNCMFSVVQSSTGVSPGSVLRLYERYFGVSDK